MFDIRSFITAAKNDDYVFFNNFIEEHITSNKGDIKVNTPSLIQSGTNFYTSLVNLCMQYNASKSVEVLLAVNKTNYNSLYFEALAANDRDAILELLDNNFTYDIPSLLELIDNKDFLRSSSVRLSETWELLLVSNPNTFIDYLCSEESTTKYLYGFLTEFYHSNIEDSKGSANKRAIFTPLLKHYADKLSLITADNLYALTIIGIIEGYEQVVVQLWENNIAVRNGGVFDELPVKHYLSNGEKYTARNIHIPLMKSCCRLSVPVERIESVLLAISSLTGLDNTYSNYNTSDVFKGVLKRYVKYKDVQAEILLEFEQTKEASPWDAKDFCTELLSNVFLNDEDNLKQFCTACRKALLSNPHKDVGVKLLEYIGRVVLSKGKGLSSNHLMAVNELVPLSSILPHASGMPQGNCLSALGSEKFGHIALALIQKYTIHDYLDMPIGAKNLEKLLNYFKVTPMEFMLICNREDVKSKLLNIM